MIEMKSKSKSKPKAKPLPKMFQGAEVVRGLGMNSAKLGVLLERKAKDQFVATHDMWIVIENDALEDIDGTVGVKAFDSKVDAVRFARALASHNVDYRVLRVTEQVLVIAPMNDL